MNHALIYFSEKNVLLKLYSVFKYKMGEQSGECMYINF